MILEELRRFQYPFLMALNIKITFLAAVHPCLQSISQSSSALYSGLPILKCNNWSTFFGHKKNWS